jgi:hypothetical protein
MGVGACENRFVRMLINGMRNQAASKEIFADSFRCEKTLGVPRCVDAKQNLRDEAKQLRAAADALDWICKGTK